MFWFRLNILCRVPGYRGHVVRRGLRCEIFRLGKRISERCVGLMRMLIILADGTRGQGLGLNLGSRDGYYQGLYLQGGEVGSGSRFLGRRNRFGRSGARSPGRPILWFRPVPVVPPPSSRRFAPLGSRFSCVALGPLPWRRTTVVRVYRSAPLERPRTVRPTHRPRGGGFQTRSRRRPREERSIPSSKTSAEKRDRTSPGRTNLAVEGEAG